MRSCTQHKAARRAGHEQVQAPTLQQVQARTRCLAAGEHHAEAQRALRSGAVVGGGGGGDHLDHAQRRVAVVGVGEVGEEAADDVVAAHALAPVPLDNFVAACEGVGGWWWWGDGWWW